MGFLLLEVFAETQPEPFGHQKEALIDINAPSLGKFSINSNAVMAYEYIQIRTNGRPGTTGNKQDLIEAVRIKTQWGQKLVIINDTGLDFGDALKGACTFENQPRFTRKESDYWTRFSS